MVRNRTKGTKQLNAEIDGDLLDTFRAYARGRGESLRAAIERAMRRDMGNPPPLVTDPPLPPLPPPAPKKKGGK